MFFRPKSAARRLRSFFPAPIVLLAVVLFAASCEKEVNIDLGTAGEDRLVVEGGIETGSYPILILTKSLSFFSRVDLAALQNAFVRDAVVKVSDGTREIRLREYFLDTSGGGTSFSFYTIDTADFSQFSFLGEVGKAYHLTIEWKGKTYTSSTVIPAGTPLDSVWYQRPARQPDSLPDARQVYFRYRDPDTLNNCVRYFTSINGDGYHPGAFGSVYIDEIINGGVVSSPIYAGYDRISGPPKGDSIGWFFKGDTVRLRWCAIDRPSYDFWNSYEFALNSVGNPFAAPSRLATNIKGGAQGVWTGYGSQYHTVVIKD